MRRPIRKLRSLPLELVFALSCVACVAACGGASSPSAAPKGDAPSASSTASAAPSTAPTDPHAASASTPPAAASASSKGAACAPWAGRGFSLVAESYGATADNNTKLTYADASGALTVHDSDPFAGPKKGGPARVIDKTITLSTSERDALSSELGALCPGAKDLAARCAPGGCMRVTVTPATGAAVTLENGEIPQRVITRLRRFFPELRGS
jgi:hypothetical protein